MPDVEVVVVAGRQAVAAAANGIDDERRPHRRQALRARSRDRAEPAGYAPFAMSLTLDVTLSPDRWPAEAACDIALRFALRNAGRASTSIFPTLAKLAPIASFAGVGITWGLAFVDASEAAVPIQEIRRWYGPPGNPPAPSFVVSTEVALAPRAEHVTELTACWIPNALLEPRHLAPATLDPNGMDNIAGPSHLSEHPALADRISLAQASVLVLNATWSQLANARATDDFLRGHVVAFVSHPGSYELRVHYVQHSWMNIGERLRCEAAPVAVSIG